MDETRINITGVSMGGYGTWAMLGRYPDVFAAGVPICGGADTATAPIIKDIPIWTFHGSWDTSVPVSLTRDMAAALEEAGVIDLHDTEYQMENHAGWERAYRDDDLFPWLFARERAE